MSEETKNILHVDDDPAFLRIVAPQLQAAGYDVVSLEDPTRAADALLESGARLVLLDIDMPKVNGLDLLKEIKRNDGGVQVIMVTGLVSMSTVLRSMRWGAEACVFKPLTEFDSLLTVVDAAFQKIDRWWLALELLVQLKASQQGSAESDFSLEVPSAAR